MTRGSFFRPGSEENKKLIKQTIKEYYEVYQVNHYKKLFCYANKLKDEEKRLELAKVAIIILLAKNQNIDDNDYEEFVKTVYTNSEEKINEKFVNACVFSRKLLTGNLDETSKLIHYLKTIEPNKHLKDLNDLISTEMKRYERNYFENFENKFSISIEGIEKYIEKNINEIAKNKNTTRSP